MAVLTFPTDATDYESIRLWIRWWLGDIDEDVISDDVLDTLYYMTTSRYGEDDVCEIVYRQTVATLEWLIREDAQSTSSTGTGELTKKEESEGDLTIIEEYDVGSDSTSASWDTVLEDLEDNPSSIGCDYSSDSETTGDLIIGGGDINGYEGAFKSKRKFGKAIVHNRLSRRSPWGRW